MDKNDMCSKAERYKNEMMKLYGKRLPEAVEHDENEPPNAAETDCADAHSPQNNEENDKDEDVYYDEEEIGEECPADGGDDEIDTLNEKFPDPDISELTEYPVMERSEEGDLGDSTGFIRVSVRTGGDTEPIVGAAVAVTAVQDGKRYLIAAAVTDISGIATVEAPAPDARYSQVPDPEKRPYSLFDVSVTARGFIDARSVDVPVFAGTTSVQNFSMVPAPIMSEVGGDSLTYFNQEPFFG